MSHYLIFGDSITFGESDPHGGWVHLLRELLTQDYIFNLGPTFALETHHPDC